MHTCTFSHHLHTKSSETCVICLEDFNEYVTTESSMYDGIAVSSVRRVSMDQWHCSHCSASVHEDCFKMMIEQKASCPQCRKQITQLPREDITVIKCEQNNTINYHACIPMEINAYEQEDYLDLSEEYYHDYHYTNALLDSCIEAFPNIEFPECFYQEYPIRRYTLSPTHVKHLQLRVKGSVKDGVFEGTISFSAISEELKSAFANADKPWINVNLM